MTIVKIIYDLIDKLRPDPHNFMADGVALFLAGMGEAKDIEDRMLILGAPVSPGQVLRAKRVIHPGVKPHKFRRKGGVIPSRRPSITSFRE